MFGGVFSTATKEEKELFGKELKIVPILEPDEIIWENLAYTGDEQRVRKYIMQVVSMFFLIANTLFTMYLAGIKNLTNKEIPPLNCPGVEISKKLAYLDNKKEDN